MIARKIGNPLSAGVFLTDNPRGWPFITIWTPDRRKSSRLDRIAFRAFKESN